VRRAPSHATRPSPGLWSAIAEPEVTETDAETEGANTDDTSSGVRGSSVVTRGTRSSDAEGADGDSTRNAKQKRFGSASPFAFASGKARAEAARKEKLEMDLDFCRVVKRYDPEIIRNEALRRPLALAARGAKVFRTFGFLFARKEALRRLDRDDGGDRYAVSFKNALTSLGPLFVKLGQNLANRPDLIQEDLMEELTRLQDRVPPFPTLEAFAIVREDAGKNVDQIFAAITPDPVAAASIGQVYKATLVDSLGGGEVAVKILRPGTRPQVVLDLFILRAAAETFFDDFAKKNLGCPATLLVDEFAEKLLEELDFNQEALNLRDFKRNFSDDPSVQIPGVYQELSSERVLVMDWQEGVRCTAPGAFESLEARRIFLQNGVESGLRQLLDFGLFHGDPHPGNVLALPSGDIAYVDFGNVAEISRANQESLIDAVVHVMNKDYDALAICLSDLGFLEPGSDVRPVAEGLREVWGTDTLTAIASNGNFSFRGLTKEFNKLLFKYPIRVPERFSLVIRALLTQENICLTLDPSFNFLNAAFPYVARRLLTDPDPNLRARLFKVVVVKGKYEWARLRELVTMAEAGANGGVKLPLKVALDLFADTTKMLAKDGATRNMLVNGLRAVPVREHVAEAFSLAVMVLGMTLGKWWRASVVGKMLKKMWVDATYSLRRSFAKKVASDLPPRSFIGRRGDPNSGNLAMGSLDIA
jgi:predicted unusual protein kinase regulating ubiquinone biosynthesis (AarF/ABC1/UbiB family)